MLYSVDEAPWEIAQSIKEFWTSDRWDEAASVFFLESRWDPFAERDTRTPDHPCGSILYVVNGVAVTAEWSIGVAQINACNLPDGWDPRHLFNTRHNLGTAHRLFDERGWEPWFFSAHTLGLV